MTDASSASVPTPAPAARVLPLGDGAFTLALDAAPGPALSARLRAVGARIEAKGAGVLDTVQSFATLTVFHAPDADRAGLEALALATAADPGPAEAGAGRRWEIATDFSSAQGPDQAAAAAALGMSPEALAAALCAQDWPVLAVGFLPGFPFLGPLPAALKLPRRRQPRLRLPAGSVAIANGFAGIYPWVSPGGRAGGAAGGGGPGALRGGVVTALVIRAPGPQTTLQDLGRKQARRHGVPLGGAADTEAHRLALALAGAPGDAATLEFRLAGPTVAAEGGAVRVALVGAAGRIARADGGAEALPPLRSATLEDGDSLAVGASAAAGGYLALWPAPAVAPVLGARGTMLRAGFGGWRGRALEAGDRLELERPPPTGPERAADWAPGAWPLRVMMGPQEDHFTPEALAAFLSGAFTATEGTDRMGARLAGPHLAHSALGADILSEGLAPGSVQVPGDGQPIILGVDAQTIGGYPKIATVISADLPKIGRLRPGDAVRFAAVTLEEARAAWRAAEAALAATVAAIRPVWEAPDAAALLGADLSGGAVDAARPHHFPHALPED